jgi:GDPmannose 4,6-dehydratase
VPEQLEKTAIVFGCSGQDGRYLSLLLRERGMRVVGISRRPGSTLQGDVGDRRFVDDLIRQTHSDYIFHFSAESTTDHKELFQNHNAISTGTLNILEAVRRHSPKTKAFITGSALQFENTGDPISEDNQFEAKSAYAVARIQSIYAARYFRNTFALKTYCGYLFNHDSPLRSERHINQKIAQTCLRIASGKKEELAIENVKFRKEFNHAADIVKGIWCLINQESIFEAVIGCGITHEIGEWVEICFKLIGRNWKEYVRTGENSSYRTNILISNPKKIMSLGWKPRHDIFSLALDMMKISEASL